MASVRQPFKLPRDLVRKPVPIPDQVEDMLFGIKRMPTKEAVTTLGQTRGSALELSIRYGR
jgi:hypothetical protein